MLDEDRIRKMKTCNHIFYKSPASFIDYSISPEYEWRCMRCGIASDSLDSYAVHEYKEQEREGRLHGCVRIEDFVDERLAERLSKEAEELFESEDERYAYILDSLSDYYRNNKETTLKMTLILQEGN